MSKTTGNKPHSETSPTCVYPGGEPASQSRPHTLRAFSPGNSDFLKRKSF